MKNLIGWFISNWQLIAAIGLLAIVTAPAIGEAISIRAKEMERRRKIAAFRELARKILAAAKTRRDPVYVIVDGGPADDAVVWARLSPPESPASPVDVQVECSRHIDETGIMVARRLILALVDEGCASAKLAFGVEQPKSTEVGIGLDFM